MRYGTKKDKGQHLHTEIKELVPSSADIRVPVRSLSSTAGRILLFRRMLSTAGLSTGSMAIARAIRLLRGTPLLLSIFRAFPRLKPHSWLV